MPATRPSSPAERCLRAIRKHVLPLAGIPAIGAAIAAAITATQPTLYRSQALLSVKPPPEIVAAAIRTKRPYLGPDGHIYDANDPERQTGPGRSAPRRARARRRRRARCWNPQRRRGARRREGGGLGDGGADRRRGSDSPHGVAAGRRR